MDELNLSIERLWEIAEFTPNDEQRQAILHAEGPLYLTAGPGSGKTRVLLWRALNLVVFHDVKPDEIYLCDARFSCASYRQYALGRRGQMEHRFREYFSDFGTDLERDSWRTVNLSAARDADALRRDSS